VRPNPNHRHTTLNDLELARQIAAGDTGAIEAFVQQHYASVLRFMRHLTRRVEDAEDLTQQSFLKARSQIGSYQGKSSLRTWLHRLAFHEYTHWKRRQRRTFTLQHAPAQTEPGFDACIEAAALLEALHQLPDALRETFLLHEVQELPIEEVAKVLSRPVGTIKSRLFHARRRLRAHLEGGQEEKIDAEPAYES
jgi:RNA polymerase sigma-70 factor, ECF subfamily